MAEWAGDDRAGAAIQALVRVSSYANAPDRQDAGAALQQLRRALVGGVLYLDGGWGRIVAGMARRAAELGAEFRYGEGAEEIAAGEVRTERATYAADRIVVALPALGAANLLAARFPAEAEQIQALEPVRAACLDLCLSALPRPDRRFVLGLDRADYLSVHSGVADLAPPGGAVIHAARYLGADKADAAVRQELEALLDRAQPGWRSAVVHARWAPELEVCGALDRIDRPRPPIQPPALAAAGIACAGDYVASPGMLADAAADTGWRAGAC